MCGRFTLRMPVKELAPLFQAMDGPDLPPRYNVAPTQDVLVLRKREAGSPRELCCLHWGLTPAWAADPAMGNRAFNARSETAAEKPMFRAALKLRRCAILADGFFEWRREGSKKLPLLFEMADGSPFAMGGIWERWSRDGAVIESCAILTTEANDLLRTIHDRMPVIIPKEKLEPWLACEALSKAEQRAFFAPFDASSMRSTPVSTVVNNARNDSPDCVKPI